MTNESLVMNKIFAIKILTHESVIINTVRREMRNNIERKKCTRTVLELCTEQKKNNIKLLDLIIKKNQEMQKNEKTKYLHCRSYRYLKS